MTSAPLHVDPSAVGGGDRNGDDDSSRTVSVSLARLQHLQSCEMRADLQESHIQLLQNQIDATDATLKLELARGEKHAEALMRIARTCDDRVDELKIQHAAILRVKDDALAALKAELAAVKASHAAAIGNLEGQVALLQAQATLKLTDIHVAVAALRTLEIHPVRPDHRQFAEWHTGPVPALANPPPPPVPQSLAPAAFDREWCIAACGTKWKVEIEAAANMCARVVGDGDGHLTLRGAAPLPRRRSVAEGRQQDHQLPACRIVIEAYDRNQCCCLGLVAGAVRPTKGRPIRGYGGWCIVVKATTDGSVGHDTWSGWTAMNASSSTYATTSVVPPVPPGSAVEFAVDYAAGTCRVAFYTPAAVAGGFVEAPHAKMELRFVATEAAPFAGIPARSVTTLADSGVELYPAVETGFAGAAWRFAN